MSSWEVIADVNFPSHDMPARYIEYTSSRRVAAVRFELPGDWFVGPTLEAIAAVMSKGGIAPEPGQEKGRKTIAKIRAEASAIWSEAKRTHKGFDREAATQATLGIDYAALGF
jgi:hypothetical protein